jgi:glycosyltransferase involved in cell wall biosynthesis
MNDGYNRIFDFLTNQNQFYNFVLAEKDIDAFLLHGANPAYIRKIKNGINSSLFKFSPIPKLDKTIYLGKITPRKNQSKFQNIENIDFVGNNADYNFKTWLPNYLGEWSRTQIYEHLTDYSNLLLLSEGEADPLVVKEALIAGLGIIVNKSSAENLDKTLDFITIIEDNKMDDLEYIIQKINENKQISVSKRKEIREYGISQFDISIEVKKYMEIIKKL